MRYYRVMQYFYLWPERQGALDKKTESLEAGWHFRDTDEAVLLLWEDMQRDKCYRNSFSVFWFLTLYDNDTWNTCYFFFPTTSHLVRLLILHLNVNKVYSHPTAIHKQHVFQQGFSWAGIIAAHHQLLLPF